MRTDIASGFGTGFIVIRPDDHLTTVQRRPIHMCDAVCSTLPRYADKVRKQLRCMISGFFALKDENGRVRTLTKFWQSVNRSRFGKSEPAPVLLPFAIIDVCLRKNIFFAGTVMEPDGVSD